MLCWQLVKNHPLPDGNKRCAFLATVECMERRLDDQVAGSIAAPVERDSRDVEGFDAFRARHRKGLAIVRVAVEALD